jgi:hypothetical protein
VRKVGTAVHQTKFEREMQLRRGAGMNSLLYRTLRRESPD